MVGFRSVLHFSNLKRKMSQKSRTSSQCLKRHYGVATISRLLNIIGPFCRISSLLQGSFAKETYNLKEPTNRSHPITSSQCLTKKGKKQKSKKQKVSTSQCLKSEKEKRKKKVWKSHSPKSGKENVSKYQGLKVKIKLSSRVRVSKVQNNMSLKDFRSMIGFRSILHFSKTSLLLCLLVLQILKQRADF